MYQIVFDVDEKHLPTKSTSEAACYDLKASVKGVIEIHPGERKLIMTGLKLKLRPGTHAEVRSRSGLAIKYGVIVLNSPGTIDSDYPEEVGVILYNSDKESTFNVYDGDRIAQLYIADTDYIIVDKDYRELDCMSYNKRTSGFGSTGIK